MSKWNRDYWTDLGERVAASAVGGGLTMLAADASGVADYSPETAWLLIGIPSAVSLLKGLLVNLGGTEPSASLVDVTSTGQHSSRA